MRKKIIKKITGTFGKDSLKNIDVLVERGNPVKIILKVAEEKNCDLVVMGFTGRGTLEDAAIGSTVNRVLHKSKLPVLVVHNVKKNS